MGASRFCPSSLQLPGQLGVHIFGRRPARVRANTASCDGLRMRKRAMSFIARHYLKNGSKRLLDGSRAIPVTNTLVDWRPGLRCRETAIVLPPRWKMTLVTLLAVYPFSRLLGITIGNWISGWPMLLSLLIFNASIVTRLTCVLMPQLTRLFKPWLYPKTE